MSRISPGPPMLPTTDGYPLDSSSRIYNNFKSSGFSFSEFIKLPQNNLIMILNLVITLSVRPNEFTSRIVNDILSDTFFDKLVNFLRYLNVIVEEEFRTLIKFYEVIVHHLPICDIAYTKISALLHMTYVCLNERDSRISEPYLLDRLEELIQLVEGKKYLLNRENFHYTDTEVYPSHIDLYETRTLKPSIIHGPYNDSEQYLDIQFKLLREDCFCGIRECLEPIRTGINGNQSKNKHVYKNVKSVKLFLTKNPNSKICHRLTFSPKDEHILKKEDWTTSKKFMNGSLLFFTQNDFVTFFVATVEENVILYTNGKIVALKVSVVGNPYQLKIDSYYDMIEPKVFFEPYYQSLKVLQSINPYDFPLPEDILCLCNEIVPSIFVSKTPSASFHYEGTDLNQSQVDALNAALSQKFTLIQGPPGTGKSHLSRKLIKILVEDSTDSRPVLVICMRNRALDKILEPLAKIGLNILRFGWTENEVLSNYTFYKWKRQFKKNVKPNAKFLRNALSSFRKIINDNRNINNPVAVEDVSELHRKACAAYRLLNDYYLGKMFLSKKVQVIGATTTGATKRNNMISEMNPKAVIIEEAAEIFESYLVTSLPRPCDHLVLLGDHLQLQPITAWHNSAAKYNMNVSLFERLIKNGKGYHRLTVQHRMRPEIAELICPLIYDDLTNDASVWNYPDILGVAKNVFFLTHSSDEQSSVESMSYMNQKEAIFLLSFANYLIKQGYSAQEITILAAYSSQQNYLIKNSTKYPLIQGIQIQSIDNYQGDENEIILLSLIRSNGPSIGFLRKANRINVALSRAKAGFYMMGNADTLLSYSDVWGDIFHILNQRNSIGESLPLRCKIHQKITCVSTPEEINDLKLGGCKSACGLKKECGHICDQICHAALNLHDRPWCKKPCMRKVCADHYCNKKCSEDCGPCQKIINFRLGCGHVGFIECSSSREDYKCTQPCNRKPCGYHACKKLCHEECEPCRKERKVSLPCGHTAVLECSSKLEDFKCTKPCNKKPCEFHTCVKKCFQDCGPCMLPRTVELACGHSTSIKCSEDASTFKCTKPCKRKSCDKHKCIKLCYEDCSPCKKKLLYKLKCGHSVSLECSLNVKDYVCKLPCERSPCALHSCKKLCYEKCEPCRELTQFSLNCGHTVRKPCNTNFKNYECQEICFKWAPCGKHLCINLCSVECGPCQVLTTFRLKCGHIVEAPCSKNFSNYICTKPCMKWSSCGIHKCDYPCSIIPCPPCSEQVVRECTSGHSYVISCGNDSDFQCYIPVPIKYEKCHHYYHVECYQSNVHRRSDKCEECKKNECTIL